MSEMARVHLGVRYKLAFTGRNRWGKGKTHLLHWDHLNRTWVLNCRGGSSPMWPYHLTTEEPDHRPSPCKKCQDEIEAVFGELWADDDEMEEHDERPRY